MLEPDKAFDPLDDDPPVPDKLLDRCLRHADDTIRVDVERKRGKDSWKKINGFAVQKDATEPREILAQNMATLVVMMAVADQEEQGGEHYYRAKFHVNHRGKTLRKTIAFKLSEGENDAEVALDPIEQQEVLAVAFDRAISLIDIQNRHIDSLMTRLLDQSALQGSQTAPLLQTIETLVSQYNAGLQMQANAVSAMIEMERNSKADEARAERDRALLELLQIALPKAVDQFGDWLRKRDSDDAGVDEDGGENEGTDDSEGAPSDHTNEADEATSAFRDEDRDEGVSAGDAEVTRNPLTVFAHAFRDTLTSEQWMAISEVLSKKEMALLKKATTATNDDETAAAIMEFKNGLKPTKYVSVAKILNDEQQAMLMRLIEIIQKEGA